MYNKFQIKQLDFGRYNNLVTKKMETVHIWAEKAHFQI